MLEQKLNDARSLFWRDRGRALGLTQLATIGTDHEGGVGIERGFVSQGLLKKKLLGCGVQKILATDHMRNSQALVIHYGRQVVGVDLISAKDNEIARKRMKRLFIPTFDSIEEDPRLLWRDDA